MKTPIVCSLGILLLAGCQESEAPKPKLPDAELVGKLEEIVALRERQVKEQQVLREMGKLSVGQNTAAVTALAEARIELAKERVQPEVIVEELGKIIEARKKHYQWARALHESDRKTSVEMESLRVALLETEVRLLREQQKISK